MCNQQGQKHTGMEIYKKKQIHNKYVGPDQKLENTISPTFSSEATWDACV